jgi:hypothetical protein
VALSFEDFFSDPAIQKSSFALYDPSPRKLWRGLWIGGLRDIDKLLVVSTLAAGGESLTQETLNFLTLSDVPQAKYQMVKAYDDSDTWATTDQDEFQRATVQEFQIDSESKALTEAFIKQMTDEAEPYQPGIVLGSFVMERTPLSYLDSLIDYDTLRLVTSPVGIFGSLVKGANYLTFFWSPEIATTWSLGAKPAWAVNTMMACIWRDACIVKHKMMSERQRGGYHRTAKKQKRQNPKLILPRTIRHCAWGPDEERERISRSAHAVRAFYRQLPDNQAASDAAIFAANEYGYPEPPVGFTFVRPHTRGGQASETEAMPVVCLGLQVANLALGVL